ncbi:MAG: EthD domain-containing protein [Chromatiales bacterium]
MIKLIVAIRRRAGMSPEAFHEHWRSTHARLVRGSPAAARYMRRYVQCHTLPESYAQGEPAFDGTTEIWFDSVADMEAFYSDPDYLENVKPDESRFADMTRTVFFATREEPIIGQTPS